MMDSINFFLTVVSLALAAYAWYVATSVEAAIKTVVRRQNQLEDNDRLKLLITKLVTAKEGAKRRQPGTPAFRASGRAKEYDLHDLQEAFDALKTGVPLGSSEQTRDTINRAADDLQKAIESIAKPNLRRNGWVDALSTLQTIIPRLEQEERQNRNTELVSVKV